MAKVSMSIEEVAEVTSLSEPMLRKLVRSGELRAARIGRRILIPVSELERLVKPGAKVASPAMPKSVSPRRDRKRKSA